MRRTLKDAACLFVFVLGPFLLLLLAYDEVGIHQFNAVWDFKPRALSLYTKQADTRYVVSMQKMVAIAREKKFVLISPKVVQTNFLFDAWYPRWGHSGWMGVDPRGGRLLLVDHRFVKPVSDADLNCMMAHELGHVIDVQSRRWGHSAFWAIRCLDHERFADEIGRILCEPDRYDAMFRRYIGVRPPAGSPCDKPLV